MANSKEIEELIKGSGNNFHAKVARWFVEKKWHVVVSPYYLDQSQGKAREIDLIVEKEHPFYHNGNLIGHVVVRLFVECKFVPSPSVFWFSYKDGNAARELVYGTTPFRKGNRYTEQHHYLCGSDRVAKLFTSSNSKGAENEPFYKALNQSLNATIAMRDKEVSIPSLRTYSRLQQIVLEYPIVVCSSFDQLYQVGFDKDYSPEVIADNFQLEVRYAYMDRNGRNRDEYFLLDFVEYEKLPAFEQAVLKDVEAAKALGFSG